jgi:hypothetical protein
MMSNHGLAALTLHAGGIIAGIDRPAGGEQREISVTWRAIIREILQIGIPCQIASDR